jgi:hypothetical protein
MRLLLQCKNTKLGGKMPSVHQRAIAEVHDCRPHALVCPRHGPVHESTSDRLSVARPVRHFLGRIVPVQGRRYIA